MSQTNMASLPAVKRQHLLAEFAGLKQACPNGVYVSLTPGDVSLWSGVIFVRKGPYATAVLRFQISFPENYPDLPPLVAFSTDMFHPLISPLTTYVHTNDIQDNGSVSATDNERLPYGIFSFCHGFPHWYGRASRSRQTSGQTYPPLTTTTAETPPSLPLRKDEASSSSSLKLDLTPPPTHPRQTSSPRGSSTQAGGSATSAARTPRGGPPLFMTTQAGDGTCTYEVLRYIRAAFEDAALLDDVPLEAAGHPGAWHAWRSYRRGKNNTSRPEGEGGGGGGGCDGAETARRPDEWNWEGVWEERVKRHIAASLSESMLYGTMGMVDDVVSFLNVEEAKLENMKRNLLRTLGPSA